MIVKENSQNETSIRQASKARRPSLDDGDVKALLSDVALGYGSSDE